VVLGPGVSLNQRFTELPQWRFFYRWGFLIVGCRVDILNIISYRWSFIHRQGFFITLPPIYIIYWGYCVRRAMGSGAMFSEYPPLPAAGRVCGLLCGQLWGGQLGGDTLYKGIFLWEVQLGTCPGPRWVN